MLRLAPPEGHLFVRACNDDNAAAVQTLLMTHAVESIVPQFFHKPPLLVLASFLGASAVVNVLLTHGADLEATNLHGWTALTAASRKGHTSIVQVLLQAGAKIAHQDKTFYTPLMHASVKGQVETLQVLLNSGADVDERDVHESTALILGAQHPKVVEMLLASGADVTATNKMGQTALFKGMAPSLKLLIAAGGDKNHQAKDGFSAVLFHLKWNLFKEAALLQQPEPRWSLAAHPKLLPQPRYRPRLRLIVWCAQHRFDVSLPLELVWHVLEFLTLYELVK
eukprot:m.188650 g.188650  ORF g.188650 m.188650 type:complete len:281 (+) comp25649_c0_seq2:354-1196(+)